MSTIEERRIALIKQIGSAFAGVSREGGVSLHEADVIDNYGSATDRKAARKWDTDQDWREVPDADIERYDWILSFLDPIGFRYYIPAYMVWTLKHYEYSDSMSVDSTIYALDCGTLLRRHQMERYRLINKEQASAICAFLRFMTEDAAGMVDDVVARQALQRYWGRFCP